MKAFKRYLLTHEPFWPVHAGLWIRLAYFKRYFFEYVDSGRVRSVLDAGCGRGRYAALVAEAFPEAKVAGYDLVPHTEWAGVSRPNLQFAEKDLHTLDDKNTFDAIISVDSLEHIPHNEEILKKFFVAMREGGILYLAFPNEAAEWNLFPRRWFARFYEWEEHEHVGEQYSLAELDALLRKIGFATLFSRYTFTFWGTLAWEIEFLLYDRGFGRLHLAFMPFMKLLGILDIYLPLGKGHNLIVATKPSFTSV